ncbi:Sec-independent protein translocase protein TatC [compost metagenome]
MSATRPNPNQMTFLEHLEELRWRLLKTVSAIAVGTILAFVFHQQLVTWLLKPAAGIELIFTAPAEYFMVTLRVAFFAGLYLSLPVLLYQAIAFVAPGLTPSERRWTLPMLVAAFLLFTTGALFSYFFLLPVALKFLIGFAPEGISPLLSIGNYLAFAASLVFASGLSFELPLVMFFLSLMGLVTSPKLKEFRRYFIIVALTIAAVVTPSPDVFTQGILAIALMALYELGILLVQGIKR